MKKRYKPAKNKKFWRVNAGIWAKELRVIDSSGKQLGVHKVADALQLAKKAKLDLVEIAPKAKPPVAKIVNFGKYKYSEEKRLKKQKSTKKSGEIKEIRYSPFIGGADYETRFIKVKDFLQKGYKIRVVVKFKGRQMGSKNFGYNLMKKLLKDLDETISIDMKPKFIGRHLSMVISPTNKTKKNTKNAKAKD